MLQVQRIHHSLLRRVLEHSPRWLRMAAGLLAVALPLLAWHHGWQMKSAFNTWLSHRQIAQAKERLESDVTRREGLGMLLEAWLRTPEDELVLRALAEACGQNGLPHYARHFYLILDRQGVCTAEDRLALSAALSTLSDHTGARLILEQIEAENGISLETQRTRARIASARGDEIQAQQALQQVMNLKPEDEVAAFNHAATLAASSSSSMRRDGIIALLRLLERHLVTQQVDLRQHCFWALARADIAEEDLRGQFTSLLARMPWKSLERRIVQLVLGLPVERSEAQMALFHAQVRAAFREHESADAMDRIHTARLLQRHDQHLLVLECIPFEFSLQSAELCTARFDSLIAARLWQQAAATVNHPRVPLPRHTQAVMQAYHSLVTHGDDATTTRFIGEAMKEARKRAHQGSFIAIGRLADEYGMPQIATEAYAEASHPRFAIASHLLPSLLRAGRLGGTDSATILRHIEQREAAEPWNLELHREITYLRLLCGHRLELIAAQTAEKLDTHPEDLQNAFFHAFACHRLHQPKQAAAALEALSRPHPWKNHEKAAMSAILESADESALAASLRATIPSDASLFPEERRLLAAKP